MSDIDIKSALDILGYADFIKGSIIPPIKPKLCSASKGCTSSCEVGCSKCSSSCESGCAVGQQNG